jgi:2-polyprenyl-3-methyl-5-hydroxy-6-metoxy-1,4-benzoquinol methylase
LFEASDRLYRTTDKVFQVARCEHCGLIRLTPRPTPDELHHYYPREYWYAPTEAAMEERYRRFVLRDHVKFVMRALRSSGESGLVLDVGCGGGLFLRLLRERGVPVLGMDSSERAASVAWKINGVAAIRGDLAQSPVLRGSCAAVTMFHVVEHLYDPVSYLRAAGELLREGGRLIIQVPNAASWQFRMFGKRWNGVDAPRHLVNYRARDLENLLDHCGFEVLRRKHFSLRDNPAGFATSVAPGLDPMARRVRGLRETRFGKLLKDAAYFGLAVASLPFTLCEAACGAGTTIMLEARKKA